MGKIAFVTDSTAYLTAEQQAEYNITVVPLSVIFQDESYREGLDISASDFYTRLKQSPKLPTTSQPPVGEFVEVFERLLSEHDTILCLLLSGRLSGTLHSAQTAAQMVGGNIVVVDSKIASFGIAGPLMDGVELYRRGGSVEDILRLWEDELATQKAYFVVDTLEQLHKGGRIGGAAAVFGSILQIKPILTVVDGRIELFDKVRTHRRAMERILSLLDEDAASGAKLRLAVVHSEREADAAKLRDDLVSRYPQIQAEISELGPVVGTHTGSGVLALVYYERSSLLDA